MSASNEGKAGVATLPKLADPYRVESGDTLSSIARRAGVTVADLQHWNGVRDANKIEVGQVLYLSRSSAFAISVAFLDALRHPIANLPYRLEFDGRSIVGKTSSNGQIPTQITKDASSQVDVWVLDAQRQWQRLASTMSGYGHKLITLLSGALVVPATLDEWASGAAKGMSKVREMTATEFSQAKSPVKPAGKPSKNNPAVTARRTKGPQGQPIIVLGVDLPEELRQHFAFYKGGDISEQEWATVAAGLECEPEVLKAIAKVESGGRSAFWRLDEEEGAHVPAILYERHYFSRVTKGAYDKDHPDISWPIGYQTRKRLGKVDTTMHDGKVDADDVYSSYATSYMRLINAYRLDPGAALQSCSWGKFQIMGANFALCGERDVEKFVRRMCTSDAEQIILLAGFIRRKPPAWKNRRNKKLGKEMSLWDAVKTKNWRAIAFNYNGPGYEENQYHTKLAQAYEQYKKTSDPRST